MIVRCSPYNKVSKYFNKKYYNNCFIQLLILCLIYFKTLLQNWVHQRFPNQENCVLVILIITRNIWSYCMCFRLAAFLMICAYLRVLRFVSKQRTQLFFLLISDTIKSFIRLKLILKANQHATVWPNLYYNKEIENMYRVSIELLKCKWKFGRMRNAVETGATGEGQVQKLDRINSSSTYRVIETQF